MAFQGSLDELPLPDILQLVAVSGKTGSFTIRNERAVGRIYISDGQIVHAELGTLEGEEAVYELAIWREGDFEFTPGENDNPTTISKSNTSLLIEAARRLDEWQVLAKRVPSTRMVPVFTEEGGATTVSLSPQEWAVVRRIDESRTIEEIAVAMNEPPFEVAKVLYGMITHGLIGLRESQSALPAERLREMTPEELRATAQGIHREATAFLAGHNAGEEVETALGEGLARCQAEPGPEPVEALFEAAERAVFSALGPNQARSFLESIAKLIRPQGVAG
jgi:hypothetical protein